MKSLGKYIIVALIALVVGAIISSKWFQPDAIIETVTVVRTDTIIKTVIDTTGIKPINPEIGQPVVIELPDVSTPDPDDTIKVETQKYTGIEVLSNGTITYEIFADSLYAVDFKLSTQDKIITNNITTTITKIIPPSSMLFVGGGLDFAFTGIPVQANVGLMYNRRNKWAASVLLNKDLTGLMPATQTYSVGLKIWIPLFKNK